ncbi:Poly(A) RNA polymerase gld-2 A [Echinococcus granulosus]|uniref:Poly(A) RNA polymerase gld-2 A n=1 Tax=Echinococcus granulosus TaxID=6210 RepID=W6U3H0_ECHGR|nr:Poly(A) RNA polymerase gld-2 A [Echinococcus granulosus]EUB55111.1 Poly(A) RNA polymerase gld-2 A [Echinococcus granulosus]
MVTFDTNAKYTTSNSKNNRRNLEAGFEQPCSSRRQQYHRRQASSRSHLSYRHYQPHFNQHRNTPPSVAASSHFMNDYIVHGSPGSHHSCPFKHRRGGGSCSSNSSNYLPIHQPATASVIPICHHPLASRVIPTSSRPFSICNFNCSVPMVSVASSIPTQQHQQQAKSRQDEDAVDLSSTPRTPPNTSSISTQTPAFIPTMSVVATTMSAKIMTGRNYPALNYLDSLSFQIWQFFLENRQSPGTYGKKVHFRNALHLIISSVFQNSKLFIVGSSINGFGSDQSDTDLCLVVTSQELQGKRDASAVLHQLMTPLRKCSFIRSCNLIRAKVPILKFRDQLSGIECDLNVNNVVGIYNTHLLAMYTRVDSRLRPLGVFVKHWAQKMDVHDGSRGRLSTYPLLLMLIQFLQCGCSPPVLPNLQARFPKIFDYERPVKELDMRLQLPWDEMCSANTSTLSELFAGFIAYYATFDFARWAISIRCGQPLPIDVAIRCLPPHEQAHTAASFKIFVEEPFCKANAARSLYDETVLGQIQCAFSCTDGVLRAQKPLESLWKQSSPSSTTSST